MYDVLIKGGRLIDPAQHIDALMDIAVNGDKIALVSPDIAARDGKKIIDATGRIITPGLIDMHCHVFDALSKYADVDIAGVRQGVTTVVDGGSSGQALFSAFPKYIIPRARTTVYCFLHISSMGIVIAPEIKSLDNIDVAATSSVIKSYPDIIKGVKLRMVGAFVARNGVEIFQTAKKIAKEFGLPIMVHIGDKECQATTSLTQAFLPLMERGDILTHVFTARQGSAMLPDGTFIPELRAAMERGVVLDIAHGGSNMSFAVARRGLSQGILPTVISSDLSSGTLHGPAYGLTVTMSKMLSLGLSLNQVITMTTINPAKAINIADRKGSLKPGMDADVSILEVAFGKRKLVDGENETLLATELIMPRMALKAGKTVLPRLMALPESVA